VINSTIRGNSAGTGGGIESAGTLNLFDSFVLNNTASEGGGLGGSGTFVIDGTVFSRNNAVVAGGGILVTYYGAITMTSSVLSDNHATDGGGILTGGAAALIASSITGNTATIGGGISNWTALTLEGTTVSGNTAAVGGGIASDYSMTISNSTVSGNTASVGGGGIFNNEYTNLSMYNSTVSANSASLGAGLLYDSSPNRVILKNTIFAYNGSQNCATEFYAGSLNSYGYNISSDTSCTLTGHADRTNTDPLLGPLADNGGPNQTHALLAGSPAIDAGSPDCPPPTADQRGAPRPYDGDDDATAVCDIGAFEYQGELPPTPTASPTPTPPSIGGISLNPASASGGGFDAWLLIIGLVSAGAIAAAGALSLIAMRRA